jgi:hypothetical protein
VQNNDSLWNMYIAGNDGTDLALAAEIRVEVDGTPGSNDMPGRILLRTTPDGSQAPVDAVKIDSAQNVTVSAGNLVIGTSGKGIDFSATPGTGTSELLSDYEEGTWTPAPGSGTFSDAAGQYTKIGRVVTLQFTVTVGTGGATNMTGNPFTTYGGANAVAFSSTMYTEGQTYPAGATTAQVLLGGGGSTINFVGVGTVIGFTSLTLSAGAVLIGSITYIV